MVTHRLTRSTLCVTNMAIPFIMIHDHTKSRNSPCFDAESLSPRVSWKISNQFETLVIHFRSSNLGLPCISWSTGFVVKSFLSLLLSLLSHKEDYIHILNWTLGIKIVDEPCYVLEILKLTVPNRGSGKKHILFQIGTYVSYRSPRTKRNTENSKVNVKIEEGKR